MNREPSSSYPEQLYKVSLAHRDPRAASLLIVTNDYFSHSPATFFAPFFVRLPARHSGAY
jgi:hypothetical protein